MYIDIDFTVFPLSAKALYCKGYFYFMITFLIFKDLFERQFKSYHSIYVFKDLKEAAGYKICPTLSFRSLHQVRDWHTTLTNASS